MTAELEQARAQFMEGVAHFEARRLNDAHACFEAALALAPGRASVLGNLGITRFHLGRWREAIDTLRQAVKADPDYAEARVCLGLAHEACGEWLEAAEALEQGLPTHDGGPAAWLALGRAQGMLGRTDEALRALDGALERTPDLAEAWSVRGNVLRDLERLDEAAESFQRAIECGADPELHAYYLAATRGEAVAAPPRQFVERLFDEYSADFDEHLVEQLGYCGHERLLRPLLASGRRWRRVLDLGCGTGLCGALVAPHAEAVDGVDLSAAMLDKARLRGVYRRLAHEDIAAFLAARDEAAELVMAADVFIYVGALEGIFAEVRRVLEPGGCFAFTLEHLDDAQDYRLLTTLRYAHSEAYVRRLATEHGFVVREVSRAPLRADQHDRVDGLYVYLE